MVELSHDHLNAIVIRCMDSGARFGREVILSPEDLVQLELIREKAEACMAVLKKSNETEWKRLEMILKMLSDAGLLISFTTLIGSKIFDNHTKDEITLTFKGHNISIHLPTELFKQYGWSNELKSYTDIMQHEQRRHGTLAEHFGESLISLWKMLREYGFVTR